MEYDLIIDSFARAYDKAKAFFDNDDLDACVTECKEILEEPECPRYYRIATLILLGSCLADLGEVGECLQEASKLWMLANQFHRNDESPVARESLAELKKSIDTLHECLEGEAEERSRRLAAGEELSDLEDEEEEAEVTVDEGAEGDEQAVELQKPGGEAGASPAAKSPGAEEEGAPDTAQVKTTSQLAEEGVANITEAVPRLAIAGEDENAQNSSEDVADLTPANESSSSRAKSTGKG